MFNNKYAQFNSLTLLKSMRPRRAIIPKGPDLSNFLSYSPDLNRLANFGLEMMKFLPHFEQLQYAGNVYMDDGEEGGVTFGHGSDTTTVTQEWWDAFNEYSLGSSSAGYTAFDANALTDTCGNHDGTPDGRLTNADTIRWAETYDGESDGFNSWRNDQNWVHGQHHRTGNFLTGKGMGGEGWGAMFKNLDFVAEGSEWNHIGIKNNSEIKNPNAAGDVYGSHFLGNLVSNTDISWSEIQTFLETDPAVAGKSFYDVIMTKSYESLSSRQATMFVAAMYESRERAWSMMSEVFGPVNQTWNDAGMRPYIQNFISTHNPYGNHHALAFFQFFLPIQHSVTNRMTSFYEKAPTDAWDKSALDEVRFWDFAQWIGRETYNSVDAGETANEDAGGSTGLYAYRNSLGEGGYNAVQNLINNWFGATDPASEKPMWEGYRTSQETSTESGHWVGIPETSVRAKIDGSWENFTTTQAFVMNVDNPAYSYDKKWSSYVFVKNGSGDVGSVRTSHAGWADVLNHLWSGGHISSRLNPTMEGMPHPQYIAGQFNNLSYNTLMSGAEFANNWPVFANGMLAKWGIGLDLVRVMEKSAATRVASAVFKQDTGDYSRRKGELEDEEKLEQKGFAKRTAERKKWHKKLLNRAKKMKKEMNGGAGGSSGGGKNIWNKPGEAKFGSKAYQQRLTKSAARISKSTKKRKSMLDKVKQATQ